jgi:hypothetical protein
VGPRHHPARHGLRLGELAGLHRRRVHLNQPIPTVQVVDVRYQASSQFGSGFKPRPKSDASIREIPLAPQVVEAIRRRLPPDSDPAALLFTGPGGGPGHRGDPGVKKGPRTVLSRHNFRRTYHGALAKLANLATAGLRPTAARVLGNLRDHGPLTAEQLAVQLKTQGRTARMATIDRALAELAAAGAAAADPRRSGGRCCPAPGIPCWRWSTCTAPMTSATPSRPGWKTPASPHRRTHGPPGQRTVRTASGQRHRRHYRHTTPEMAARVVAAVEQRLVVVLATAEAAVDQQAW